MRILITAGATREYIDPVRFISNASSGKMGYALVLAALKAGHKVTLITTVHRASSIEHRVPIIKVETAAQMFETVKKYFPQCDCLIMAAAVADYTPIHPAKTKIKKNERTLTLKLKPTPDILKWAGAHKNSTFDIRHSTSRRRRVVVGFALEDKTLRQNAEKKLRDKKLDMIIANTPVAISANKTSVLIKTPDRKWLKLPKTNKTTVAKKIISLVEKASR
jgi:phosphopantothenoylcysteine decarboxylase/phosphopantothenate--cysteine ligase